MKDIASKRLIGALKMQDLIIKDMKIKDRSAGHENA